MPPDRLCKKLKEKLSQTKSGPESKRIIVAQTWMVDQLTRASPESLARFRSRIFDQHSGVAAVLLVHRTWNESEGRYTYNVHPLLPDDSDPAFQEWILALAERAGRSGVPEP